MDLSQHLVAFQVIVPLLSAPLALLLRPRGLAWAATTAAAALSFAISLAILQQVLSGQEIYYEMGSWAAPYGIALAVDAFSGLMTIIVSGAALAALLVARQSVDKQIEAERQPLFYSAWLLVMAGLLGIVVSADAFNIFVFMEISSLASYILIAGGPDRWALPAVFKYLIMGTIGATFYLIGVGLIYMMTGTLNLADMADRVSQVTELKPILVAAGFITVGMALKAAVFPLHVWLPNAYTYAPHAVTVFLAACGTKVALYVLLRFDFVVFQPNLAGHEIQFGYFLMPLALLAILIASGVAVFENNLKRLLAYSSVAQIGYILLGASFVNMAGMSAGIMHFFNHALAKGTLFIAVAALAMRMPGLNLSELAGAGRRMPVTMGVFVVGALSLIGVPGTAGFTSKWLLISASLAQGTVGVALVVAILVSSLLAVIYIWRVIEAAYFSGPADSEQAVQEAPLQILIVAVTAAAANIYFGLNASLPLTLAEQSASALLVTAP